MCDFGACGSFWNAAGFRKAKLSTGMMSQLPIPNLLSAPDNFTFALLDLLQAHKIDWGKSYSLALV